MAHANWQTLDKNGYVRTKILVDSEEGMIKFEKVKLDPVVIIDNIKALIKVEERIEKFEEMISNRI